MHILTHPNPTLPTSCYVYRHASTDLTSQDNLILENSYLDIPHLTQHKASINRTTKEPNTTHSTQHTAHSTQHTTHRAHTTQHTQHTPHRTQHTLWYGWSGEARDLVSWNARHMSFCKFFAFSESTAFSSLRAMWPFVLSVSKAMIVLLVTIFVRSYLLFLSL